MGVAKWLSIFAGLSSCDLWLLKDLIVNTRCVYYRLKLSCSHPDNLTLCPILDFANHTRVGRHMSPMPSDMNTSLAKDFVLFSPHDTVTQNGSELYLTYGHHSNCRLFVEYGFVDDGTPSEADVQDIVERILEDKGKAAFQMKTLLQEEGYWGYECLDITNSPIADQMFK